MILQETNGKLKAVKKVEFALEKELQNLIERNLEEIFGCRLINSEFPTSGVHNGRIDTLAISEDGNPVIIEYKKVENSNIVTQGLFYLDWLKDHLDAFRVAAQKQLGEVKIDVSTIRVICIAPGFDRYSLHAVNHMGVGLELWQYHRYENGILQLDEIIRTSDSGKVANTKLAKKALEAAEPDSLESFESHVARARPEVAETAQALRDFILGLDPEIVEVPLRHYIAYKVAKNVACIEIQQRKVLVTLRLKYSSDMPAFARDVSQVGHWGTGDVELSLTHEAELPQAFELVKRTYLQMGA